MKHVEHPWIYRGKMEEREYQVEIARKCTMANTLVVLPTGLGKTAIAILATAFMLERNMYGKVLVLAPTRPLVEQHRKSFLEFLKIGEDEARVVTGKIRKEEREKEYGKADIVFATPQTIANDIKNGIFPIKDFQLLIVDEAHRAVGNYSYTFVARAFRDRKKRIIGFTASPSSRREKIEEIKDALGIRIVEVRDERDEDVARYVKGIEMEYVAVPFPVQFEAIRSYLESITADRVKRLKKLGFIDKERPTRYDLLTLQSRLSRMNTGLGYAGLSYVAEMLKLEHAVLLIETQTLKAFSEYMSSLYRDAREGKTKAAKRLVKEFHFQRAYELATELLEKGVEHPKLEKLEEIVSAEKGKRMIIFTQYRLTARVIAERISGLLRASVFIGQNRGMKQEEQKEILERFRNGELDAIVATSIGEEGLDIPEVDLVIFYEPVPSEIRFIQRRGRTGRKREGRVIVLIAKGTRDETYHWSTYHKRRRMRRLLQLMKSREGGLFKWMK